MTSPARSLPRDGAAASSPLRNAFASSSTKPVHSPFLARRPRVSNETSHNRFTSPNQGSRQPDAISTSSSTLVNAESTADYRPWEVRSDSGGSSSSLDSLTGDRNGRATPTLSALEDIGTLPSIHISPLPRRSSHRSSAVAQSSARSSNASTTRPSVDSTSTRARPVRQLCPDDCRCSDQDIDLGLCRRVVGSSSSASESGSLSVGVHPMKRRAASPTQLADGEADREMSYTNGVQTGDQSQHSWRSISEPRSQGRDFEKDPILVPRSARARNSGGAGRRSSTSSHQRSFDQLQTGLDTLDSNESDADSDADQVQAAQRRAESMARWTARRLSLLQSAGRSPATKLEVEETVALSKSPPIHPAPRSLASDGRTPDKRPDDEFSTPLQSSPLKATPGRKSIAAVFESMQKEREARAAEEHKAWQEKQARRERERAARAFGVPLRRRSSVTSSVMDSPVSASTVAETPASRGQTTVFHSISRSPVSASPLLSSPGSPKVDEGAAAHVQPRHLGEEAAERIPETLAEAEEAAEDAQSSEDHASEQAAAAQPATPPTTQTAAFTFASQPMALDLSPLRSASEASTPASSPRKNAHRRQNTNNISVAARTPTAPSASVVAARKRFDSVLREKTEFPRTPVAAAGGGVGGILSSAAKKSQLSAARKAERSVRFSPRPDYRSDSGSWDESATKDDSREAAVERLLLPAREIVIPEILSAAATPAEEKEEESEASVDSHVEAESQSPAKTEAVSAPHTPSPPPVATANTSVRFPGAYAPTPPHHYSRHVIRPSPKIERVLPASSYGLFPEGASIPRESTPPPTMLPPDDPRRSPRSPRPVDLGRDGFARFDAGLSSDGSTGSVEANTLANESRRVGEVGMTIGKILRTVEETHASRLKRKRLGQRLDELAQRVAVGGAEAEEIEPRRAKREWQSSGGGEEHDRQRTDEVRREVVQALAVIADRLVNSSSVIAVQPTRSGRVSPRTALLLVLLQCALITYLLGLAERKAENLRMFHHPPQLSLLYTPTNVEWNALGVDRHLQPLLEIPGLHQAYHAFPPLPSRLAGETAWRAYRSYARLNGVAALLAQVTVYALSQVLAYALLVCLAPLQLLWLLVVGVDAL